MLSIRQGELAHQNLTYSHPFSLFFRPGFFSPLPRFKVFTALTVGKIDCSVSTVSTISNVQKHPWPPSLNSVDCSIVLLVRRIEGPM